MIYFDNAATGGFKHEKVIKTVLDTLKYSNANAGRSGHKLSIQASQKIYETRKNLSLFLGQNDLERIIFTSSCTEALNFAINGLYKDGTEVITTATEHNAVLRPLYNLKRQGKIDLKIVYPKNEFITDRDIENAISNKTSMVVLNATSNVNGTKNDYEAVGYLTKKKGISFIVDGAQIGGHEKINFQNIDALCLAGHKGLLSTQGVGVLAFSKDVDIRPYIFGGAGIDSFNEDMPSFYPERLEAGTQNLPAILSLNEGIKIVQDKLPFISKSLTEKTEYLLTALSKFEGIKVYSKPNPCGIVAFAKDGLPSPMLSEILSQKYDIAIRGGFHCAPLMHKFLHTETDGLNRVSFAIENTEKEIDVFIDALKKI